MKGILTRGAKNRQAMVSCYTKLNLDTYNVVSLSTEDRLGEVAADLDHFKWDILGLSEMKEKSLLKIKILKHIIQQRSQKCKSRWGGIFDKQKHQETYI